MTVGPSDSIPQLTNYKTGIKLLKGRAYGVVLPYLTYLPEKEKCISSNTPVTHHEVWDREDITYTKLIVRRT